MSNATLVLPKLFLTLQLLVETSSKGIQNTLMSLLIDLRRVVLLINYKKRILSHTLNS